MAELEITLRRSVIERPQNQCTTVKALGLGKVNSTVTKPVNEAIKGMVNTILHLVGVEGV